MGLFFPAWWAWANIVSVIHLLPGLSAQPLGLAILAAMAASALVAASAPHALDERAWAFPCPTQPCAPCFLPCGCATTGVNVEHAAERLAYSSS